jgi:hypothetical protein
MARLMVEAFGFVLEFYNTEDGSALEVDIGEDEEEDAERLESEEDSGRLYAHVEVAHPFGDPVFPTFEWEEEERHRANSFGFGSGG